ncbi:hypothetical protein PZ938_11190 [Luteipulveratus sp. YIM 133132]|uniref:hypothetical protein n=1 Tax=Luteipulveratus flavus TaxID=3031728 RepID=UPI0023AF1881|nr:hypothetical protein [Luteipulveratus sp. YIM 133132]MDE9366171.1 hypothetical protein [Luteipulveratus sp. YIM 133132]
MSEAWSSAARVSAESTFSGRQPTLDRSMFVSRTTSPAASDRGAGAGGLEALGLGVCDEREAVDVGLAVRRVEVEVDEVDREAVTALARSTAGMVGAVSADEDTVVGVGVAPVAAAELDWAPEPRMAGPSKPDPFEDSAAVRSSPGTPAQWTYTAAEPRTAVTATTRPTVADLRRGAGRSSSSYRAARRSPMFVPTSFVSIPDGSRPR